MSGVLFHDHPSEVPVFCYPASADSQYIPLLFEGIRERYRPVHRQEGSLDDAIAVSDAGHPVIVHVHWEEFILDGCKTEVEADAAANVFISQITALHRRSVPMFWTVHNEVPHSIHYLQPFLRCRRALASSVDIILVHNRASIEVLESQVPLDRGRLRLLPHPSYLDRYESGEALASGLVNVPDRVIQGFGWIRHQKGFGEMIRALPSKYLLKREARIRISGDGEEAPSVMARQRDRPDVEWDVRHIPDAEVPELLRSSACVVLPYERVLTSGVALLVMSVGAVLVSVDLPQIRELLPVAGHRFLYRLGDGDDLRRAVDDALGLTPEARRALVEANVSAVDPYRPTRIASQLAELYVARLNQSPTAPRLDEVRSA